jgi:hypothetical protein
MNITATVSFSEFYSIKFGIIGRINLIKRIFRLSNLKNPSGTGHGTAAESFEDRFP